MKKYHEILLSNYFESIKNTGINDMYYGEIMVGMKKINVQISFVEMKHFPVINESISRS